MNPPFSRPFDSTFWPAAPAPAIHPEVFAVPPPAPDSGWRALQQSWIDGGPVAGFQPGWARVAWRPDALIYEVGLAGNTFRNAATQLNQLTWELGDVCEIFVQADGAPHYLEVHITPENQRLQLRFPPDGLAAVRAGQIPLRNFIVDDPNWVQTATEIRAGFFLVRAIIPAATLGLPDLRLSPTTRLRSAVCRYDYAAALAEPVLSSTAPLRVPFFHRRHEWSPLHLLPA